MELKPYEVLKSFQNYYPGDIVGLSDTQAKDLLEQEFVKKCEAKKTETKKPEGNKE